jgi:hypothetical protein
LKAESTERKGQQKSDSYIGALSLLNANPRGSFGDFANKHSKEDKKSEYLKSRGINSTKYNHVQALTSQGV